MVLPLVEPPLAVLLALALGLLLAFADGPALALVEGLAAGLALEPLEVLLPAKLRPLIVPVTPIRVPGEELAIC